MTRIRVNPEILSQSSNGISGVSGEVKKTGEKVWRSAKDAPSYDGQFGPVVRAIAQGAVAEAQNHQSRLSNESVSLAKRSEAFLAADTPIKNIINRSVGFPIVGSDQKLHVLPFENIIQLQNMGISGNPENRYPVGFVHEIYGDAGRLTKLVNKLMDFDENEIGQKLAVDTVAADLLFVVYDGKKVIARWGKEGGREVFIKVGKVDIYDDEKLNKGILGYATSNKDKEDNFILLSEDELNNSRLYNLVLPHEMQHQIDYEINIDYEKIIATPTIFMNANDIERLYEDQITERVKTEIIAWDVGFTFSGNSLKSKLNGNDGIFTKQEKEYILNDRGYQETYVTDINEKLKKILPGYVADVYVDCDGNIKVKLIKLEVCINSGFLWLN